MLITLAMARYSLCLSVYVTIRLARHNRTQVSQSERLLVKPRRLCTDLCAEPVGVRNRLHNLGPVRPKLSPPAQMENNRPPCLIWRHPARHPSSSECPTLTQFSGTSNDPKWLEVWIPFILYQPSPSGDWGMSAADRFSEEPAPAGPVPVVDRFPWNRSQLDADISRLLLLCVGSETQLENLSALMSAVDQSQRNQPQQDKDFPW